MKTKKSKKTTRKIIAITHVTLDGVMQAPGGPEEDSTNGFTHGGWSGPYGDEETGRVVDEIVTGEFGLLLGRRTYEIFAAYWPNHGDNPIGKAFNQAAKYVATRSLDQLDWNNSHKINGDAVSGVRRLKATAGPELHIWGSGDLLQSLIAADLVDEYRVWVYPVVLGKGKRLFENGVPPRRLTLVESRSSSEGVLLNTYRPAGPLPKAPTQSKKPSKGELLRRKKLAAEGS
ncbi:MAG TPA: dihydrofolate reductase family protein [Verrucomicrobiae bacterium]|jgi:dihydrofolate reductase|nr:dihydrofolate reductase family protein [Verrucomicrobiae bacterium]